MKVLTLTIGDHTYTTGKITAFLSKEAMKINRDAVALAKESQRIQEDADTGSLDAVETLANAALELSERKAWLICEVYGNKFTPDDLEKELSTDEIDAEINAIISGINGVVSKN